MLEVGVGRLERSQMACENSLDLSCSKTTFIFSSSQVINYTKSVNPIQQ